MTGVSNSNEIVGSGGVAGGGGGAPGTKQKRQLFPEKLWDLVNNQPASGIFWSKNGKRIEIDRSQLERFLQTSFIDKYTQQPGAENSSSSSSSSASSSSSTSSSSSSQTISAIPRTHQFTQSTVKFRSHNFDSFIRQLHFYGFKKSGNSYHHEKFQRDRPEALCTMKRKYSSLSLGSQTTAPASADVTSPDSPQPKKSRNLASQPVEPAPKLVSSRTRIRTPKKHPGFIMEELESLSPPPALPPPPPHTMQYKDPVAAPGAGTNIKMYTIDSTGEDDFSFTNVRETSVKAVRDGKSVQISIPDLVMNSQQDDSWPKTLVLENQNILSAYFIYKLN